MGCITNFTITKGVDNQFDFTIKQNGSTLPMVIDANDMFTAELRKLSDNTIDLSKPLSVISANNGLVRLVITATEADSLLSERGMKVDNYYIKPVYKLLIICNTTNNGNFISKVDKVYVD